MKEVDTTETFLVDGRRVGAGECRRLFAAPLPDRMRTVLQRAHGPRLVDVGAYDGRFVAELVARQPEIDAFATDYDRENLRIARFLHPELSQRFVEASAYALPFDDAEFDCITFQEVIEHLEGAAQAVKELNRVLRVDGTFIVTTPNAYYWRDFRDQARSELRKRARRRPPTLESVVYFTESEWNRHIYSWTPATLLTLLEVNGFRYRWHGYSHDERSTLARTLMGVAPFVAPVLILEARKVSAAPARLT